MRTIAYASHVLLPVQRKYCTTRKELLAVVKFCRRLLGRRLLVDNDMSNFVSRSANNISGGSETDLWRLTEFIGIYGGSSYFVKPPCHHLLGMFDWGRSVQEIALGLLQNIVSDAETLYSCFSMVSSVSPWLER